MTIARLVLVSVLLGGAETVLDLHLGFRSLAVSVEELFCLRAVLLLDAHIYSIIFISKLAQSLVHVEIVGQPLRVLLLERFLLVGRLGEDAAEAVGVHVHRC